MDAFVRDAIELALIVAVGGMLWSVVTRLRRRQLPVHRCPACDRPTSQAYDRCRHCGARVGH